MVFLRKWWLAIVSVFLAVMLCLCMGHQYSAGRSNRLAPGFEQMRNDVIHQSVRLTDGRDGIDGILVVSHTLEYTYAWYIPEDEFIFGQEFSSRRGTQTLVGLIKTEHSAAIFDFLKQHADMIVGIGIKSRFPRSWALDAISAESFVRSHSAKENGSNESDFPPINSQGLRLNAIAVEGLPGAIALPVKKIEIT